MTAPSPSVPTPRRGRRRGFVLLIVMMSVAALSVIVWLQTDTAVADRLAAVSIKHDTQARAIAERCLEEAITYARSEVNRNALVDFDTLLDPGIAASVGTPWPNTLFQAPGLPIAGSDTTVIHDAAASSGDAETQAMHRYTVVRMQDGACLIRYDDNQDEALVSATIDDPAVSGNNGLGEGGGIAQELRRDRDSAIMVTAIGIYPYNGTPGGAYQRARARVTMRAMLQTEVSGTVGGTGFALEIGGNVSGGDGVQICGLVGGLAGQDSSNFSGSKMCSSGRVEIGNRSAPSACVPGDCVGPWAGNDVSPRVNTNTSAAFNGGPPAMEWPVDLTAGLPAAATTGPPGGTAPYLNVGPTTGAQWFRGGAGLLGGLPAVNSAGVGIDLSDNVCDFWFGPGSAGSQWVYYWDHTDNHATTTVGSGYGVTGVGTSSHDDCTAPPPVLPEPCRWNSSLTYNCGTNQSLCWKASTRFAGSAVTYGGSLESSFTSPGLETFKPQPASSGRLATYSHHATTHGTAVSWEALCGSISTSGASGGVTWTGSRWEIVGDINAGHWGANGTRMWFENGASSGETVRFSGDLGTSGTPIALGVVARNSVEIEGGDMNVVCPGCTPLAGGPPFGRPDAAAATGHFIWAPYGHCELGRSDRSVGHVTCRTVRLDQGNGDETFVGDVTALTYCSGGSCVGGANFSVVGAMTEHCFTSSNPCSSPSVCMQGNLTFIGDVVSHGDVQFDQTNVIGGRIVASHLGTDAASFSSIASTSARNSLCLSKGTNISADTFIFVGKDLDLTDSKGNNDIFTPRLYVADDILLVKDHDIRGFPGAGDVDVWVGDDIDIGSSGKDVYIEGRVRVTDDFRGSSSDKKVRIRNDGGATGVTVSVQETTLWMEPSW